MKPGPNEEILIRYWVKITIVVMAVFLTSACAYKHYLGIHGPSIKKHPVVHQGFSTDQSCLICHGIGSTGKGVPKTNHPDFTGCLKCHNDNLPR